MCEQKLSQIIERYKTTMFAFNRRVHALIRELMPEDLTIDQYFVMATIQSQGRCTHSELAEVFCVGKSSITAIISRLFDKNLIRRVQDERDRRVVYLLLTEEGEKLTRETDAKLETLLAGSLEQFSDEEVERFLGTYEKLVHILQQPSMKSEGE